MKKNEKNTAGNGRSVAVVNYMGGISYQINPLDTLYMVTASSIFGEPQYYRDGIFTRAKVIDAIYKVDPVFAEFCLFCGVFEGKKTSEIMEEVIDEALSYDFEATIRWALKLRTEYFMRLNPQVIMVRAALHPKRKEFNADHPGLFSEINEKVMKRADEPGKQMAYYLYKHGSKKGIPSILKRNWAAVLEGLDAYQANKYKNGDVAMIDVVRVSHANGPVLDELMRTGSVTIQESEKTWEIMRSAGASWKEIFDANILGHMALLRNLRGIFGEESDVDFRKAVLDKLKQGVKGGMQFPFRYYSALNAVDKELPEEEKKQVTDALEECIDISCGNMPLLKGKTMCLSDNSGSAWGCCQSEYGKVRIAEIDNLSSVITARNSEEGYVGVFGDKLTVIPISKDKGVLKQTREVTDEGRQVGGSTENGVWLFLRDAIDKKEHWDNIFIYSDMQAGHGGLYGTGPEIAEYTKRGFVARGRYIDVAKLIDAYRRKVNPKVNVFCVQTAGYNNVLVPEYGYRTNILYGWTGKEAVFADAMICFWDEKDGE